MKFNECKKKGKQMRNSMIRGARTVGAAILVAALTIGGAGAASAAEVTGWQSSSGNNWVDGCWTYRSYSQQPYAMEVTGGCSGSIGISLKYNTNDGKSHISLTAWDPKAIKISNNIYYITAIRVHH